MTTISALAWPNKQAALIAYSGGLIAIWALKLLKKYDLHLGTLASSLLLHDDLKTSTSLSSFCGPMRLTSYTGGIWRKRYLASLLAREYYLLDHLFPTYILLARWFVLIHCTMDFGFVDTWKKERKRKKRTKTMRSVFARGDRYQSRMSSCLTWQALGCIFIYLPIPISQNPISSSVALLKMETNSSNRRGETWCICSSNNSRKKSNDLSQLGDPVNFKDVCFLSKKQASCDKTRYKYR